MKREQLAGAWSGGRLTLAEWLPPFYFQHAAVDRTGGGSAQSARLFRFV